MDLPDVSESGGIQKITDDKEQVLIPVPYLWEKSRYPPSFLPSIFYQVTGNERIHDEASGSLIKNRHIGFNINYRCVVNSIKTLNFQFPPSFFN